MNTSQQIKSEREAVDSSNVSGTYRRLQIYAVLLLALFASISALTYWFRWGLSDRVRPIITMLVLMTAAFAVHLFALKGSIRLRRCNRVAKLILVSGVLYRLILLPAHPILEIDIYRYMWDGLVVTQGISPYRYSPEDVLLADQETATADLQRLAELRDASPGIKLTLERIHYEYLTTIYPPVSQAIFAMSAELVPLQASSISRLVATKAAITLFDILTMLALLQLLRHFRKPDAWLICYAWSPLVLKEFANSGHLDAIAICLATWSILIWIKALRRHSTPGLLAAAALLGLAIGAKMYPVVFVPIIAVSIVRHAGIKATLLPGVVLILVTFISLAPMWLLTGKDDKSEHADEISAADVDEANSNSQRTNGVTTTNKDPDSGFAAFMSSWQMNDFLFMILQENLKPRSEIWFSVLPETIRAPVRDLTTRITGRTGNQAAFAATRCLTACIHLLFALWLAYKAWFANERQLMRMLFLTIAWFWLLLPTLNPWYWIWAMPLLPFARLRTWLLLSGLVVVYYFRFWLRYHVEQVEFAGFQGTGVQFYDHVIVWLEHLPFLVLLIWEVRTRKPIHRSADHQAAMA